jgi:phosphoenolpyruvate synthase/pyruvate phosphate dikinase
MTFTRKLKQLSKNNTDIAGGKGASLGEMINNKIPVPDGFVVLSSAFEKFIQDNDLNTEIDSVLDSIEEDAIHTIENASEKIQCLILNLDVPEEIQKEILDSFKKLDSKFVAVRSSATCEDSALAAWAGQLESYLNTTKDNLIENVKKCWASLFTPRAIFYRFEKKIPKEKISVAVAVQKMIDSEESGIAFSVHPITQDENQMIIEAGFGLGEAIVSGKITPDSYVVDKKLLKIIDVNISEQTRGLFGKNNGGNEWRELGKKGMEQVLNEKEILELSKLILEIENHYGFPCDIEWAKSKGKFFITQSRPITTLDGGEKINQTEEDLEFINEYKLYFEAKGFNLLIMDIIRMVTKSDDFMSIIKGGELYQYIGKDILKIYLNRIIKLCSDKKRFSKFVKKLESIKKDTEKSFDKIIKDVNPKSYQNFLNSLIEIIEYYRLIDFDIATEEDEERIKKEHPDAFKRLKEIGHLKNNAKQLLNKVMLSENDYLKQVVAQIANKYSVDKDNLFYYREKDLTELINKGKQITKEEIEKRKKASIILCHSGKIYYLFGDKALDKIREIKSNDESKGEFLKGTVAYKSGSNVVGKVKLFMADFGRLNNQIKDFLSAIQNDKDKIILVAGLTSPEMIPIFNKISAIVTDQGGLNVHAAIISREMKIPCIVGVKKVSKILKDGDKIEVDTNKGIIKILQKN